MKRTCDNEGALGQRPDIAFDEAALLPVASEKKVSHMQDWLLKDIGLKLAICQDPFV